MSIIAYIEFVDFFSQKYEDSEEITIDIKHEEINYQDKFPNSKGVTIKLKYFNKDIKIVFTVSKDSLIIGKGEIVVSQKQISANESLITKWINIDQNEKKAKGVNSITKINTKISLSYINITSTSAINNNSKSMKLNKGLALNKNFSGNINVTPSMRSNVGSCKQKLGEALSNTKLQTTPKTQSKRKHSNILNLSQKYKAIADDAKDTLVKMKGKSQDKPNKNLVNNSISAFNYNLSYTDSNSNLNSLSINNISKGRGISIYSNSSIKKNCSSRENKTTNNFNQIKNQNPDNIMDTQNTIFQSIHIPNLQSKIDDEIENHVTYETSDKDSIYNDENIDQLEAPLNELSTFSRKFNVNYSHSFCDNLPDDLFLLNNEACLLMEELFKLQDIYFSTYKKSLSLNKKLKDLLVLYNTKYRIQNKKSHYLSELQENLNIKNIVSTTINREEKSRLKDIIYSIKNEISIFKHMYKLEFDKFELAEFKQKNCLLENKNEKTVLLKSLITVYNNKELWKNLPIEKQGVIKTILIQNGLIIEIPRRIIEKDCYIEKIELDNPSNTLELNFHENTFKENNNFKNYSESDNKEVLYWNESRKADSVDYTYEDEEFDKKLKITLINNKKNFKLNRISKGIYEYSGHKLRIILERDIFKVKLGSNGSVDLIKFLELTTMKTTYNKNRNHTPVKNSLNKLRNFTPTFLK